MGRVVDQVAAETVKTSVASETKPREMNGRKRETFKTE